MKFSYNLEALRCLREAPHELKGFGYITISITSDDGREESITTWETGEGLFRWSTFNGGHYEQLCGTGQFSIAKWTDRKARQELRKRWRQQYLEWEDPYEEGPSSLELLDWRLKDDRSTSI